MNEDTAIALAEDEIFDLGKAIREDRKEAEDRLREQLYAKHEPLRDRIATLQSQIAFLRAEAYKGFLQVGDVILVPCRVRNQGYYSKSFKGWRVERYLVEQLSGDSEYIVNLTKGGKTGKRSAHISFSSEMSADTGTVGCVEGSMAGYLRKDQMAVVRGADTVHRDTTGVWIGSRYNEAERETYKTQLVTCLDGAIKMTVAQLGQQAV